MTGSPRLHWEDTQYGGWTGHVDGIDGWLFQIWAPGHGDAEWSLAAATMPGMQHTPYYGQPYELKAEAERRLANFTARITGEQTRWAQLRDYLTRSAAECDGAAALNGPPSSPTAVRFRAEAAGYLKALEKMAELEAPQ